MTVQFSACGELKVIDVDVNVRVLYFSFHFFKAYSHQVKGETKVKISFDICRSFFNYICFRLRIHSVKTSS